MMAKKVWIATWTTQYTQAGRRKNPEPETRRREGPSEGVMSICTFQTFPRNPEVVKGLEFSLLCTRAAISMD